jgi:hypothetical protein
MRTAQLSSVALALLVAGCDEDQGASGSGNALSSEVEAGRGGPPDLVVGETEVVLDCVKGAVSAVHAVFACGEITIYTCKDLSNVVIELEDGQRVRFEDVSGQVNTFQAPGGQRIVGVWIKAGNNASGDGPGYGERVDAPDDSCDDPPGGGTGGDGGPCVDNDPDTFCGEAGAAGGGEAGRGGSDGDSGSGGDGGDPCDDNDPDTDCGGGDAGNGGDPQWCTENPNDPGCTVD